jgi:hypothetical protein
MTNKIPIETVTHSQLLGSLLNEILPLNGRAKINCREVVKLI